MTSRLIRLSAKGIKQLSSVENSQNRFAFIVGADKIVYDCSILEACFISKRVSNALLTDRTFCQCHILSDKPSNYFSLIETLWRGDEITVTSTNAEELLSLSNELENEELTSLLLNSIPSEISKENCLFQLRRKQLAGLNTSSEIKFIASSLSELDISQFSASELEEILSNDSVKLDSENELLDAILQLASKNDAYYGLLKYLRFEFMDSEHVSLFLDAIYPDRLDLCVWKSITHLILRNTSETGIFASLRAKCGGNPHLKGLVKVSASSSEHNECYSVIDLESDSFWTSDLSNSWIQFDFRENRVLLRSYMIMTFNADRAAHLKQWKIEGSEDGKNWVEIDERDTDELNGRGKSQKFSCAKRTNELFRYIRILCTGRNWFGNNRLVVRSVELFGILR